MLQITRSITKKAFEVHAKQHIFEAHFFLWKQRKSDTKVYTPPVGSSETLQKFCVVSSINGINHVEAGITRYTHLLKNHEMGLLWNRFHARSLWPMANRFPKITNVALHRDFISRWTRYVSIVPRWCSNYAVEIDLKGRNLTCLYNSSPNN